MSLTLAKCRAQTTASSGKDYIDLWGAIQDKQYKLVQTVNDSKKWFVPSRAEWCAFAEELGITMSAAFNIFARKMIREHGIPFEVSADPFYSESNMQELYESIKQLEQGKVVVKTLKELEAMEND